MPHPFDRVVAALEAHGQKIIRLSQDRIKAACPSHNDAKPSLAVTRGDGKALLYCFAGCKPTQVLQAVNLRSSDLFDGPRNEQARPEIVATYDYFSEDGHRLQKVRFQPKAFKWRREDASARGGWSSGFQGATPGLYRLKELLNADTVYIVEGEKSADRLVSLGLAATCGPGGASSWKPAWTTAILSARCREVVILADNDSAGQTHGERIAQSLYGEKLDPPVLIKLITLPTARGGDVSDFLDVESLPALLAIVNDSQAWFPGAKEEQRRKRRNELSKLRMRKSRARFRPTENLNPKTPALDTAAVAAVMEALIAAGSSLSCRRLNAVVMPKGYSRRVVERALEAGVRGGMLIASGGQRRGCARLYSLSAKDCVVTPSAAHYSLREKVAKGCAEKSVPPELPRGSSISAAITEGVEVRQCAVTPFAVTQGERSSKSLQESVAITRHTGVTAGGALGNLAVSTEHRQAIAMDHCCGKSGEELRCKLCRWSPTYLPLLSGARNALGRSERPHPRIPQRDAQDVAHQQQNRVSR